MLSTKSRKKISHYQFYIYEYKESYITLHIRVQKNYITLNKKHYIEKTNTDHTH